ncbi:MAG: putative 2OG-Fe(II) oxygenase [Pseudomonadota bacterium]
MAQPPRLTPANALRAGAAAFQARRYDEAHQLLAGLSHPQALNMAAVSAQKLGNGDGAAALFAKASRLAPTDADIANNRGHFELERSDMAAAERWFRAALSARPNLVAAGIGLAKVQAARNAWGQAADAWRNVLASAPTSRAARYGLGTALLESGQVEAAADLFQDLLNERDAPAVAYMLGRACLELNAFERAEPYLTEAHSAAPSIHSLRTLANLYWMQGETSAFDRLVERAPPALRTLAIRLVLETGDTARAQMAWDKAFRGDTHETDAWTLAALIAREAGDSARAASAADKALSLAPADQAAMDARIVADLMLGDPDAALARLRPLRSADPQGQLWLGHESVARRMAGHATVSGLCDTDRYVRAYTIAPPEGFGSLDGFNRALADVMRDLHNFTVRPLDQSLRGGTQTTRNLLDYDHPLIKAYIAALDAPIRQYLTDIGRAPDHPMTARNTGDYRFKGMWSVRLTGAGYHEAHMHPEGWISSAYYVAVPGGTAEAEDKAGWIGFGKPPYATRPDLDALKWVAPKVGMVVLFPSYMWHGTRPISDTAERMTAPFDLLPG